MVEQKFKKIFDLNMPQLKSIKMTLPPKIKIPKEIKLDFKKDFNNILAERKTGVFRRKRYAPF